MVVLENKDAVIEAYKEAERPLTQKLIDSLDEVDSELVAEGLSREIAIIELQCRICSYKQTALVPAIADLDNLECGNCGNMTAQEAEPKEWWEG